MSGSNQQKVVLGKALMTEPQVLSRHSPTNMLHLKLAY